MSQPDVLESLQKRAMNVVFPGYDYTTALTIIIIIIIITKEQD